MSPGPFCPFLPLDTLPRLGFPPCEPMARNPQSQPHPLEAFRARRGWPQRQAARHFGIVYGRYRQVVSGHGGASLDAAQGWAKRSRGEFAAYDVLLWHQGRMRQAG